MYIKTKFGYFKSFNGTNTAGYTNDLAQALCFHCGADSANWTAQFLGIPYELVH